MDKKFANTAGCSWLPLPHCQAPRAPAALLADSVTVNLEGWRNPQGELGKWKGGPLKSRNSRRFCKIQTGRLATNWRKTGKNQKGGLLYLEISIILKFVLYEIYRNFRNHANPTFAISQFPSFPVFFSRRGSRESERRRPFDLRKYQRPFEIAEKSKRKLWIHDFLWCWRTYLMENAKISKNKIFRLSDFFTLQFPRDFCSTRQPRIVTHSDFRTAIAKKCANTGRAFSFFNPRLSRKSASP